MQRLADSEVKVEVHCVRGHLDVKSNERTDRTVKTPAEGTGARRCAERFVSLAHINRTLIERKWEASKHWFKARYEGRTDLQPARYDTVLDTEGQDEEALREKTHIARAYYQLKSGDTVTDTYLKQIDRRDSDRCWECGSLAWMDIHHMLFTCQTWRKQ